MSLSWALAGLLAIVVAILAAGRSPRLAPIFRWLPVPLWCYALPALAVAIGWLPSQPPTYRLLTDRLLPVALALLLCGVDLPAVVRSGGPALLAAVAGAAGIVVGVPLGMWLAHPALPPEAWRGAGALAGTWTGGTMNLLALRTILDTPEDVFGALILVDAVVAYGWMAVLVSAAAFQSPINRWLRATRPGAQQPAAQAREDAPSASDPSHRPGWRGLALCALLALGLAIGASLAAPRLPTSALVSSATGWMILLVTTAALSASCIPSLRRLGAQGDRLGYPCLYLVLAATGAQANLGAVWSAPMWIVVGLVAVGLHGAGLLLIGRAARIPLGILATASQANIGGVVSAPLVGAVYDRALAPVGLVLALAGNAIGTYLGLAAAALGRALLGSP